MEDNPSIYVDVDFDFPKFLRIMLLMLTLWMLLLKMVLQRFGLVVTPIPLVMFGLLFEHE